MATNPPLTPEEQLAYDAYVKANPDTGPALLGKLSVAELKDFLAVRIAASSPAQIGPPQFSSTAPTVQDTSFSQQPYGVTGNRQASKATGQPIAGSYTGFRLPDPTQRKDQREPLYFDGDEDLLNTLSRTEVMTIQTKMKQAGILGKYRLGVVDEATSRAFIEVLAQANKIGADYSKGLEVLQQAGPASKSGTGGGGGLGRRVSNPDDLGKIIDNSAGLILGRKVDPSMKQRIIQAYNQIEQQQAYSSVQAPDAGVFAEKQITKKFGAEADAYKFAEFAKTILGNG